MCADPSTHCSAGEYIDLEYFFLFTYNGPQTARVRIPAASFRRTLPSFAEHEGDIEGVRMRVTPDCKTIIHMYVYRLAKDS